MHHLPYWIYLLIILKTDYNYLWFQFVFINNFDHLFMFTSNIVENTKWGIAYAQLDGQARKISRKPRPKSL